MLKTHDLVASRRGGALRSALLAAALSATGAFSAMAADGRVSHEGTASFYGREEHGGKTASGERFNMNAMTAAHRTAPLGSRLKVTNLRNGRTVIVRVNDRGPFVRGRIIDLSRAAAGELGFIGAGVTRVHIETADADAQVGAVTSTRTSEAEPATTGTTPRGRNTATSPNPPIVLAERDRLMIERGTRPN